jgi:hypothetical protein
MGIAQDLAKSSEDRAEMLRLTVIALVHHAHVITPCIGDPLVEQMTL